MDNHHVVFRPSFPDDDEHHIVEAAADSDIHHQIHDTRCELFQFVINTIFIGLMSVFGVVGNMLSLWILQRDTHNRVAVFLLQSLAVADTLVLIIALVILSLYWGMLPWLGQVDDVVRASAYIVKVRNQFSC